MASRDQFFPLSMKQSTDTSTDPLEAIQPWVVLAAIFVVTLSMKVNSVDSSIIKGPMFALSFTLVFVLYCSRILFHGAIEWFASGAGKFLLPFLLLCCGSLLFSSVPYGFAVPAFMLVLGYCIFFLAGTQLFRDVRSAQHLIFGLVILSTILGVIALAQFLRGEILGVNFRLDGSKRVMATLGNSNFLGGFLSLTIPLALSQMMSGRPLKKMWAIGFALAVMVVALFLTQARTSIAATAVSSVLIIVLLHGGRRVTLVVISSIIAAIFAAVVFFVPGIGERFSDLLALGEDVSVSRRLFFWEAGIKALFSAPLLGHGLGSHELVIPQFRRADYWMRGSEDIVPHAHNELLETAVELGVIGVSFYVALIVFVFWKGMKVLRVEERWKRATAVGIFFAIVSILLDNIANVSLRQHAVGMVAWLLSGILVSPLLHSTPGSKYQLRLPAKNVLAMAPIVLWGILIYFSSGHFLAVLESDSRLLRARMAETLGRTSLMIDEYLGAVEANPYNLVARLELSMTLLKARRTREAVSAVQSLREIAPFYPKASFVQSLAMYELGNMNEAMEAIERELTARDHPDAFYVQSLIFARMNDSSGVRRALEQVLVQNLKARSQIRLDVACRALLEMGGSAEEVNRFRELVQQLAAIFPRNEVVRDIRNRLTKAPTRSPL